MPKKHQHSGNSLFAKLPPEIRYEIWCMLLVERKGPVKPVHVPTDSATETFFSLESGRDSTFVLDALLKTCRLFYQDQEDWMIFYKFNEFQFHRSRDCLTYVAAITSSRRNAIRSITLVLDIPYQPSGVKKERPGDRLRAIAKLCPNLRVLRHEKFLYRADSLTNWAILLAETLEPIIATLPLLKEVYILGGIGGYTLVGCHMTLQSVSFTWKTSTIHDPYNWVTKHGKFSECGEKVLKALWEILSKRRTVHGQPLEPRRVKRAIATTPILTLGQNRRYQSRVYGARQNVRCFARGTVPDFIFGGMGTVKDIRFPRDQSSPELLIGTAWYSWDAIFSSNRLSEYHSKSYVSEAVYRFRKKYVSWVYFSGTSKGRRHGNRSPQSKLINCIWRLNWQDKTKKLDIFSGLYNARHYRRHGRRRW